MLQSSRRRSRKTDPEGIQVTIQTSDGLHLRKVGFALEIVGDQRTAVDRVFFLRDDGDLSLFVAGADPLDHADRRDPVADNHVAFHSPSPLSS